MDTAHVVMLHGASLHRITFVFRLPHLTLATLHNVAETRIPNKERYYTTVPNKVDTIECPRGSGGGGGGRHKARHGSLTVCQNVDFIVDAPLIFLDHAALDDQPGVECGGGRSVVAGSTRRSRARARPTDQFSNLKTAQSISIVMTSEVRKDFPPRVLG
ncbi:hypothetical protein EVAR_14982_1 [Eumeta japonica]|uniref:Uncharacterized protein n=1 Tax=Eumeta variegata TaxID=151549 RepID=A0A4C1X5F1_EUMVA|nr:hypothetical protein EVAR_14982_1 [Eumeta japonica]